MYSFKLLYELIEQTERERAKLEADFLIRMGRLNVDFALLRIGYFDEVLKALYALQNCLDFMADAYHS